MALRSLRERVVQTLSYEAGGFLLAMPLYGLIVGDDAQSSSILVIAVAIACMIWSPLHNTAFDWAEWQICHRVASERPHTLRFVHAVSHEVTSIIITTPIIMIIGGHSFWHALLVDIGLTLLYSAYAYFFHILYDYVRPMTAKQRWTPAPWAPRILRTERRIRRSSRSDDGLPQSCAIHAVNENQARRRSGSSARE